jgi:hypothetical protein
MPKGQSAPDPLEGIKPDELTARWNEAKAKADRANRNLLQYGGALAAMLGISAGSSGIWAIVKAMPSGSSFLDQFIPCFVTAFCGAGMFGGFLFLGLLNSFRTRGKFEREADELMTHLVKLYPDRFLPKPGAE